MNETKTMLCVGGPLAGRRQVVLNGTGFRTPVIENRSIASDEDIVKVATTDYREEVIHTPEGAVSFWSPVGQTPLESLRLLLDGYEKSKG